MAETSIFCIMTNSGKALQAKAHNLGVQVVIDKISVGDGGGSLPTPYGYETALVNEVWSSIITSKALDENNPNELWLKVVIPATEGDFWIREFGVWAQNINDDGTVDPDTHVLFAYGNHAEYYKTKPVSGQSVTHELSVPIVVSETADVKIVIPESGYASKSDLDAGLAKVETCVTTVSEVRTEMTTVNQAMEETKTTVSEVKTDLADTKTTVNTQISEVKTTVADHTSSIEVIGTVLSRIYDPIGYLRDSIPEVTELGTKIVIPNTVVKIDGKTYANTDMTLGVNDAANWDDETYSDPAQRAGTDCYLYTCLPTDGTTVPSYKFSVNSTVPDGDGYTEANTRKIGGFHCECADIPDTTTWVVDYTGATEPHHLAGLLLGNIIPASIWDLWHRPKSDVEGMLYSEQVNKWIDIYLAGWDGTQLVSQFGATTADGTFPLAANPNPIYGNAGIDGETMHILAHHINKRSITRDEFVAIAEGSNERTHISGSKDWTTTGGHVDTANRRMVSNIGCEDCCGFLWQWTSDFAANGAAANWYIAYNYTGNAYATNGRGTCYGALYGLLVGTHWGCGSYCGSTSTDSSIASATRNAHRGGRLAAEPLHVRAV